MKFTKPEQAVKYAKRESKALYGKVDERRISRHGMFLILADAYQAGYRHGFKKGYDSCIW